MLPMVQTEPVHFNCGVSVNVAASPPATLPPSLTPDSDVDELVDIFFDVDVAVNTLPRIESCDLQLGDTWRGMQGKMSVTAPVKKIRKKSDNKPQSQINKCHNEKKRRELENETINQLEELLGTCLAEVKQPDKNGIVREATRQIQEVLRRRRECPEECPLRVAQCLSPVQAGEVSSTQPSCAGLHYSELTSLIEALKHYTGTLGWVLLEINSKAEIECITENIKELTLQDRTELYKKSIFSLLHVKDHVKLRPLLRNIQTFNWGSGEIDKFQAIQARLLIKNSNGTDSAGYAECVIHAAPVRGSSSEEAGSVMCVIRRCEDASAALLPGDGGPPAITAKHSDHIVFRLDCNFIILFCDLSGVENLINTSKPLVGTRYLELVENCDRIRVAAHLQEAVCLPAPPAISEPFRLRIAPDRPCFRVVARSRLFRAKPSSGEPDFIMSTHTVLGDEDMDLLETDGPRPPVGGPLMTSVANGESSTCEPRYRSPISPNDGNPFLSEFDLEPWASSLLGEMPSEDSKDRKESVPETHSQPLTPRAPPTPGEGPPSNQPAEEPNRLRSLLSKKPMPGNEGAVNSNNRILKDLLKQEDEEATGSETSAPHTPHTPHTPLTPHTPHTPSAALSPLHSAQPRPPPHALHAPHQPHQPHPAPQHHHNNSDVLLRILNDKSDEDAEENRRNSGDGNRGVSQPSALLSQLLSSSNGPSGNGRQQDNSDNYMERMAGVKRKFEETNKGAPSNPKRSTPENQQVTSSALPASSAASSTATSPATSSSPGMSQLCQKNQILVSLLARQQTTPTTPLPLPNPNLRAYGPTARPRPPPPPQMPPQRHLHSTLSNILTGANHRPNNMNGGSGVPAEGGGAALGSSHLQMVLQSGALAAGARYPAPHAMQHYPQQAPGHVYNNQPPQTTSNNVRPQGGPAGDSEVPSDLTLSDILDEVIENMPDADRPQPDVNVRQRQGMKEKNAMINAIRQSLMQYEAVGKSPGGSSPSAGAGPGPGVAAGGAARAAPAGYGAPVSPGSPEPRERWRALQCGLPGYADPARARALVEQERARLLQLQRTQQMLVSPEAAEQPQADLGSTINALVSATPPNVALTRTDYHHQMYHQNNQMGPNYGTNKITTSQQNPMLSRQLSVAGSGAYSHSGGVSTHTAAALHTPMTPAQPYHRPPRPHLGAGNGGGGAGAGGTSEYVRNELRAVVGARARPELHALQPPDMDALVAYDITPPGGGSVVGGRASSASTNSWESQQSTPSTTEAGSAEAARAAGGDEARAAGAGAASKASLLQKLLSQ
ncbi:nuclear receptor coactivator 2-like isoform X3 [Helicoverpa zea]|uniref:nuclear receptor coactivator 2-like isoform X3 n=1 Tax=Helicoverpa zea TaxID=7113 RepID=UPI001F56EFB1|nr:nuclear receptor coactivator 2-like isoform X3 [Helicoverpa zea]